MAKRKVKGRPPKRPEDRKEVKSQLARTADQETAWRKAADAAGLNLSVWIRDRLDKAAEEELKDD